jgi:sulfate/thiosulfate transport system substrate-binding protein
MAPTGAQSRTSTEVTEIDTMREQLRNTARPGRRLVLAAGIVAAVAATAACGGSSSTGAAGSASAAGGSGKAVKLALTAYSTPQVAYEEIIPAFQKTDAGKNVTFSQSYGASGAQSRAIAAGLPTDVAALSLAPDVDKLVDAGLVDKGWASVGQYKGFVTNSVVALIVRKGNPKGIKTWDDLAKPGVQVVVPNPFTSGGAKWDVMAAYGAQIKLGKSEDEAIAWLKTMYKNVVSQDKDARTSLQTFSGGKGDVLLGYENEAITAQQKGEAVNYVLPDQTILIQNPAAVISKSKNVDTAKAFVDFLTTDEAQKIYAAHGYRPVNPALVDATKFPTPAGQFTIDDLGGWSGVNKKFFDPEGSVLAEIEKSLGVTTG